MFVREDLDDVAVVRLAHGKVSALDVELCDALAAALDTLVGDASRAVILTGTGSAFSAGVDLFRVLDGGAAYLDRFLPALERLFRTLLTVPKPVVAAVNGHAIAGGCIIAAACDYRVMVEGPARIGIPELIVGVPFPALPFEIVGARAQATAFRQLVNGGRTVGAGEAVTLGLIDEAALPETVMARAEGAARRMMSIPAIAFALTKRAFTEPILARVQAAAPLNAAALAAWADPAVQAQMRAYVQKTVGRK